MAQIDTRPAKLDIIAAAGDDLSVTLTTTTTTWLDGETLSAPITTFAGASTGVSFTTSWSAGTLQLSLTDTQTGTTLGEGRYKWALTGTEAGVTTTHLAGVLQLTAQSSGSGSTSVSGTVTVTAQSVALTVNSSALGSIEAHIADTVDAHDASAISFVPTGSIAATDVQAAVAEVASDAAAALTAHTGQATDAHDASAISVLDTAGNYTATDVEAVLTEQVSKFAPGATPTSVGVFTRGFDRRTSAYNLKASNIGRLRAGVGRAQAGTGLCRLSFIGESTVAGNSATYGETSWPDQLAKLLIASGCSDAGQEAVANLGDQTDPRYVRGSGWVVFADSNLVINSATTNALTFTSTRVGTIVNVIYSDAVSGGSFTVNIDGAGAITVNTGNTQALKRYTVTGLANTTHSVVINRVAGNTFIHGVEVVPSNTVGVRTHNLGYSGGKAANLDETLFYGVAGAAGGTLLNSDCVFVGGLEINDATASTVVATWKTQMQTIITAAKANSADVVLVGSNYIGTAASIEAYHTALYELADTNDCPLIDTREALGAYATANTRGLMNDTLHPNAGGYGVIARTIHQALFC